MDREIAEGLVRSVGKEVPTHPKANPLRGLIEEPRIEVAAKEAADLNQAERMKLAKEGKALPDGTFPIRNAADLEKARIRAHQGSNESAAKALIRKRAKDLGVKLPPGY